MSQQFVHNCPLIRPRPSIFKTTCSLIYRHGNAFIMGNSSSISAWRRTVLQMPSSPSAQPRAHTARTAPPGTRLRTDDTAASKHGDAPVAAAVAVALSPLCEDDARIVGTYRYNTCAASLQPIRRVDQDADNPDSGISLSYCCLGTKKGCIATARSTLSPGKYLASLRSNEQSAVHLTAGKAGTIQREAQAGKRLPHSGTNACPPTLQPVPLNKDRHAAYAAWGRDHRLRRARRLRGFMRCGDSPGFAAGLPRLPGNQGKAWITKKR